MKKLKVLYLCTGNSCRSQMAEGWTNHLKGDEVEAWSAGIKTKEVNSWAIRVMAEAGVDLSSHTSKLVSDVMDQDFDYVVSLCDHARETCPIFPGKAKHVHTSFPDPPEMTKDMTDEEEILAVYRYVRDKVRKYVEDVPGVFGSE